MRERLRIIVRIRVDYMVETTFIPDKYYVTEMRIKVT